MPDSKKYSGTDTKSKAVLDGSAVFINSKGELVYRGDSQHIIFGPLTRPGDANTPFGSAELADRRFDGKEAEFGLGFLDELTSSQTGFLDSIMNVPEAAANTFSTDAADPFP